MRRRKRTKKRREQHDDEEMMMREICKKKVCREGLRELKTILMTWLRHTLTQNEDERSFPWSRSVKLKT